VGSIPITRSNLLQWLAPLPGPSFLRARSHMQPPLEAP
jgi:hypothetical protein